MLWIPLRETEAFDADCDEVFVWEYIGLTLSELSAVDEGLVTKSKAMWQRFSRTSGTILLIVVAVVINDILTNNRPRIFPVVNASWSMSFVANERKPKPKTDFQRNFDHFFENSESTRATGR